MAPVASRTGSARSLLEERRGKAGRLVFGSARGGDRSHLVPVRCEEAPELGAMRRRAADIRGHMPDTIRTFSGMEPAIAGLSYDRAMVRAAR